MGMRAGWSVDEMSEIRVLKSSASGSTELSVEASVEPSKVKRTKPRMGAPGRVLSRWAEPAEALSKGLRDWVLDQRGSTLIQFVLVLPLFLIMVFGSFAVWKVVSAKQSLVSGTYQVARYLSVEGRYLDYYPDPDYYPDDWEDVARIIIVRELENNSLLRPVPQPVISFGSPSPPQCPKQDAINDPVPHLENALFSVRAEITLPWPVRIPFLDPETITLVEKRTSYIECEPIFGPRPTPTPTPTPTPAP
jgi:hypothetical protein